MPCAETLLPSQINDPKMEATIAEAFRAQHPEHTGTATFEHDHWWVCCGPCGAQFDAVDTESGFGFEMVTEGDGWCDGSSRG